MRGCTVGALVLVSVALATGLPARDALMQEMVADTAVVESTIREVRAAPATDAHEAGEKKQFIRTFGAAEGEKNKLHGYRKRTHDDSDDGYNHYDSFHKKKGDKYGYETYSSYGLKEHGDDAGSHHEHSGKEEGDESSHYGGSEHEQEEEGDANETQNSYQVAEESDEGEDDEESDLYGAGSSAESEDDGGESSYSSQESSGGSTSGSYSTGGESGTSYAKGSEYNSDGVGDHGEKSQGYSEGGSTSSSYSTSEGDDDSESHDDY